MTREEWNRRAALAQQAEPVAWEVWVPPDSGYLIDSLDDPQYVDDMTNIEGVQTTPLFTAPPAPAAVPLTDEQVWANDAIMECNAHIGAGMVELMRLVRAVERAHGIGDKP